MFCFCILFPTHSTGWRILGNHNGHKLLKHFEDQVFLASLLQFLCLGEEP